MKLYPDSKIYIYAPWHGFTGGPELLHQLGSCLKSMNLDVSMCYYDPEPDVLPIHPQLEKYHLPFVLESEVIDSESNIMILPEILFYPLEVFRKIQFVFYWMSVDNYLEGIISFMKNILKYRVTLKVPITALNVMNLPRVEHWVQSEYARQFLEFNRVPAEKIRFVGDYLVPTFLEKTESIDLNAKKDQIAYNPKKGFGFTKKLVDSAPDLNFIPIEKMTSEEVQDLLAQSKVYIDFGHHPGRDRIPREAAASHCVVVTGKQGAAANQIDIPIPDDFKFEDSLGNDEKIIPQIIERLRSILKNFKTEHDRQNFYRDIIAGEKEKFFSDVASVFELPSREEIPKKIAVVGSEIEIEKIINYLWRTPNLEIIFAVNDELAGKILQFADKEIEIIDSKDAMFLYNEQRIDNFFGL